MFAKTVAAAEGSDDQPTPFTTSSVSARFNAGLDSDGACRSCSLRGGTEDRRSTIHRRYRARISPECRNMSVSVHVSAMASRLSHRRIGAFQPACWSWSLARDRDTDGSGNRADGIGGEVCRQPVACRLGAGYGVG